MNAKVSVDIPLESLVEAITSLSLEQQRHLLNILEDQVFEAEETAIENNSEVVAEVAAARHAYETGDCQIIEEATEESSLTLKERRTFLKKPVAERRRLLTAQAAAMHDHYKQNPEWQNLMAGDIVDY